jgi:hypothetical protein
VAKLLDKSPIYRSGVSGGFNPKSKRWHDISGKITTRSKALASSIKAEDFGGVVERRMQTPITDALARAEFHATDLSSLAENPTFPLNGIASILNSIVDASATLYKNNTENFNKRVDAKIQEYDKTPTGHKLVASLHLDTNPASRPLPNYMPSPVQVRMRLAEMFYQTEGDAQSIVDAPVELLSKKILVKCPDKELRADIEQFILDNSLEPIASELWRTMRIYGVAYPWEIWDGNKFVAVVPQYPLHIHIGYNWSYSLSPNLVNADEWNRDLMESRLPPAMFKPLVRHWDENPINVSMQGIPLSGNDLKPISDKDFSWQRYPQPMLARGFRDLTSKIVHEDAIRALSEGYRYQLWVFKLGDADHRPMVEEINYFKGAIADTNKDRTGNLVWVNPLEVEILTPKGLDIMMGNEYLGYLTRQFFRKMGISSKVVSGETPGVLSSQGAGRGGDDIDVLLYVEKARWQANQILRWATYLVKKWATRTSTRYAAKDIAKISLRFAPTQMEVSDLISNVFLPLYESGAGTWHTLQEVAGLDPDTELQIKKDEQADKPLFEPPATFSQTVQDGSGNVINRTSQTTPKGSPTKGGEARNRAVRVMPTKTKIASEPTGAKTAVGKKPIKTKVNGV